VVISAPFLVFPPSPTFPYHFLSHPGPPSGHVRLMPMKFPLPPCHSDFLSHPSPPSGHVRLIPVEFPLPPCHSDFLSHPGPPSGHVGLMPLGVSLPPRHIDFLSLSLRGKRGGVYSRSKPLMIRGRPAYANLLAAPPELWQARATAGKLGGKRYLTGGVWVR